jgi:DNA mismatch endonuclease (patch repair protein)
MADTVSKKQRSWNMSRIRSRDTKPEVKVRSWLFRQGFRFRKNDRRYPGRPDVVLPKYHTVIFVNGCFWHHHEACKYGYTPKTRTEFWLSKFRRNQINDKLNRDALEQMGWRVIVVWECELKKDFEGVMKKIADSLLKSH